MVNRRSFLKDAAGAAGIAFRCLDSARAQQAGSGRRREVTVGGRRVKTVDVHAHALMPEARAMMGGPPAANEEMAALSVDDRLRAMDQQGIDMQAISINPFWYGAQREVAARIVELQNQKLAELCKAHPDRFVAYATVALQYPDLAAQQLEDGVKKLGLRGGSIGARCNADQVIVVNGSFQAIEMALRLLSNPDDPIFLEDPGYAGMRGTAAAIGLRAVPVPVDAEGFRVDDAIRACPQARLAYVTPSHQMPTGAILSASRRMQLLAWAQRCKGWIIEDDYDGVFRYRGQPLASMQGIDESNRVLYVSTFSKVLAPGLRVGYVVAPPHLSPALRQPEQPP